MSDSSSIRLFPHLSFPNYGLRTDQSIDPRMKHLLIVGVPGVGKTTLVKRLAQELREDDRRLGFWLSSLDGRQALLAHRDMDSEHRVGAYKVNVAVLDELAVGIVRRAMHGALILFLDELGKMELFSKAFQGAVEEAVEHGPRIVATGGIYPLPFLDTFKRRKDVELVPLSETNRKTVYEELRHRLTALCDEDERVGVLQREADRICEMIVASDTAEIDIEIQQAKFRDLVARMFPDKQTLYPLLYESRFRRLWQQFRQG
ncbi:MAG: AAA family ATPase [Candidatus Omnitrophica bacterium]|nr:AAA family ATPase [Candidatus Omnitrophota bacterium]